MDSVWIDIFPQKSDAKAVLLHHDDIQDFLQVRFCTRLSFSLMLAQGDEEELSRLLAESRIAERVEVDENGSGSCPRTVNP